MSTNTLRTWTRRVSVLAIGNAIGHGSLLASLPILTHLYDPASFGAFGVAAALIAITALVAALRYEYALPICDPAHFAALRKLCLWLSAAAALLIVPVATLLLPLLKIDNSGWLLTAVSLGVIGTTWLQIGTFSALRDQRVHLVACARACHGVVTVTLQIIIGLQFDWAHGLLIGHALGMFSAGLLAILLTRPSAPHQQTTLRTVAGRYRSFPLVLSWSAFFNILGIQLPIFLVASLFGQATAGLYLVAQRILSGAAQLLATSGGQVFYAEASELIRNHQPGVERLVATTEKRLLIAALAVAAILGPLAWWGFGPLFGDHWALTGMFLVLLLPSFILQVAVSPVSGVFSICERHTQILIWDALRVALVGLAIYLPYAANLSSSNALGVLSATYAATYVLLHVMVHRLVNQLQLARETA